MEIIEERIEVKKVEVDIEGRIYLWEKTTITVEEIITLAGWEIEQQVVEITSENLEITHKPGHPIEVKPGHGFSKKVRFKRGCK